MPTSAWAPAVAGNAALASQYNALLGNHAAQLSFEGTTMASNTTAEAATFASNTTWCAQPFVLSGTEVRRVRLRQRITGSGADVTVTLRPDNAGSPSTTILATLIVPREFLSTSARWIDLPLVATGLTNGATYWIVVSNGGDSTDRVLTSSSGAASPFAKTSTDGTTWSATATQLMFAVASGSAGQLTGLNEDAGARWTELEYDASGNLSAVREITGSFRNTRTLSYDAGGALVGVV